MSAISLSFVRNALAAVAIVLATLVHASAPASAPPLPAPVVALVPQARTVGGGELTWFGLPVYRGYLWSADGRFSFETPFALDLRYHRALRGTAIAQRSVEEMRALGGHDDTVLAGWGAAMAALFPDVRKGDHIVGVYLPQQGARFFYNGRVLGEIADPAFARAFFGIWLDPRTSRPDLRRMLLGRS